MKMWLISIILIGAGAAQAATVTPSPSVQLTMTENNPIKLVFSDGREAQIFHVEGPADQVKTDPFKISDNTCTDYFDGRKDDAGNEMNLGCHFEIPQMTVGAALLWTKNPDASKIGKLVTLKDDSVRLQSFLNVDALSYILSPWQRNSTSLPPSVKTLVLDEHIAPRIVCSDYRWLPGATAANVPVDAMIMRWSTETQASNEETGDTELRPGDQANDVSLKATADHNLVVSIKQFFGQQAQNYYGPRAIVPTTDYNGSSQMQLALLKDQQTTCSIGLSSSGNMDSESTLPRLDFDSTDPDFYQASMKPYIYHASGQDIAPQNDFIPALPDIVKSYDASQFE